MAQQKEGKCCLIATNVILFLLGAGLAAFGLFLVYSNNVTIPDVKALLAPYIWIIIVGGAIIAIVGILGWCASAGGCWLVVYTILILIVFIVSLIFTVVLFIMYFFIKKGIDAESGVWKAVHEAIVSFNKETPKSWIDIQDLLNCCGFGSDVTLKTGKACFDNSTVISNSTTITNCQTSLFEYGSTYFLWLGIAFIIVDLVLLILVCSSCKLCCAKDTHKYDF